VVVLSDVVGWLIKVLLMLDGERLTLSLGLHTYTKMSRSSPTMFTKSISAESCHSWGGSSSSRLEDVAPSIRTLPMAIVRYKTTLRVSRQIS
jgi:hypothetical protein